MSATENTNNPSLNMEKCSVVLLDVAGTTTSINFVKETLFPYALKQAEEFLKTNWDEESVKSAVKLLQETDDLDLQKATDLFKELTEKNSENSGLKTLQGLIYKKGYDDGELKAHIFEDVQPTLELWSKTRKIAIFSTGSTESQQLLFKNTTQGDLTSHINNYFDQTIGPKVESESYVKIAEKMECKPEEMAFITDNTDEAKAAKTAGLAVALVKREGNAEIAEEVSKEFQILTSFKDVVIESSAKRKIEEDEAASTEVPPTKVAKTESTEKPEEKKDEEEIKVTEEKMEVDNAEKPETTTTTETETAKTEESTTDKTEEKTEKEVPTENKETNEKPAETETESKEVVEEATEKKEEEVKENNSNGEKTEETKPVEEKEKIEAEKENNSEIANGGNTDGQNGVTEEKEKQNGDDNKTDETEIKVKKIDETVETTTTTASEVSVEA